MKEQLFVHYQEELVGSIIQVDSQNMRFEYAGSWCESTKSFPISISLPLDGGFASAKGHSFFSNLLPEGSVRDQICKALKISSKNDFELLRAIGGDCAGALRITDSEVEESAEGELRYERITEEEIARWSLGTPNVFSGVTGKNEVRLSLAGAQDKLPVHVEGDEIFIPKGNAPSTHILKFASSHYSHLPENETFITLLAREVGLPTVDVKIRKTARGAISLVPRYDRRFESGRWLRMHQEDFCQALGIDASCKYEKEGGPSLKQCAEILRNHTTYPLLDLGKLMEWIFFNLLVANADAHGKNLSLLYNESGSPTLAPFYDLVCTRNYKNLSREMAMNLGGAWDPDLVTKKHFEQLAIDLGFRPKFVLDQVDIYSEKILTGLPVAMEAYGNQFGPSPVLERLPIIIRKQIRRVRSQIRLEG